MDALEKEYWEKRLNGNTFCAAGASCYIIDKNEPIPCDTCIFEDICGKVSIDEIVKRGIKSIIAEQS